MVGANDSAKRPLIGPVSQPSQDNGPIRPMAHVERSSREQNLMHATRVGRSSPDGSPSFWLPCQFTPGGLTVQGRIGDERSQTAQGVHTSDTNTFFPSFF